MKVVQTFFKAITITSTTLLLSLAGCAFDEPIDYTTGKHSGAPESETGGTPGFSSKSVAAGNRYTCAIKADDTLQCWGRDTDGQSTVPAE